MARNKRTAPYDKAIGANMVKVRNLLGLTQSDYAEILDISYQQVYKYEAGINRVSAGQIAFLASSLEVDVMLFFKNIR